MRKLSEDKKMRKFNIYLPPQEIKDLQQKCSDLGVTRSTFIRMLVNKSLYPKKNK